MLPAVAIFGPTAAGKSAVALALAEHVGGEIVSCDAMQAYAGLPILTNQPDAADLARVPHHLVGVWSVEHRGSVAEFGRLAHAAIDQIVERGRRPVLVGGSGLYLRAAVAQLAARPQPDPEVRARYQELYAADPTGTYAALVTADPVAAAAIHPHDARRVVRGLELHDSGTTLAPDGDSLWSDTTRLPTVIVGLDLPAELVAERIAARTEQMFAAGVEDEVRRMRAAHHFSDTAERIHGLQDVTALIDGHISRAEAQRRLVVRTRRYAKRQRTWMRKIPGLQFVSADRPPAQVAGDIEPLL